MDDGLFLRLEAMLVREKGYADAKEWAIGKLCYSGVNGVRDAVECLRRELKDGHTAHDQAQTRLVALLEQGMADHRRYQHDEYNCGTSIFMAALDMVGGRREWPNEDELENARIRAMLEEQRANRRPEPGWLELRLARFWDYLLRKWQHWRCN